MKGLELSRKFYETYGAPMLHEKFPELEDKLAIGLVGDGSECFGNDAVGEIVVRAKSASAARIAVKAEGKVVAVVDIPKTDKWRDVRVKVNSVCGLVMWRLSTESIGVSVLCA